MKSRFLLFIATLWMPLFLAAQIVNPVTSSVEWKQTTTNEAEVLVHLTIEEGWHVYSTHIAGGPTSATIKLNEKEGAEFIGGLKGRGAELSHFDDLFGVDVRYYEHKVTFVQKFKLTGEKYKLSGSFTYGACNNESCIPPTKVPFSFEGINESAIEGAKASSEIVTNELTAQDKTKLNKARADSLTQVKADSIRKANLISSNSNKKDSSDYWASSIDELKAFGGLADHASNSLWRIFFMGFLGGLLALFTPCVWPIIPFTVSFFLKRTTNKKKGIREAVLYGLSIIVIYVGLGLAATLLFGATALNEFSTNAVFNIVCCLLLIVFAISFLGYFELELPSSWQNKLSKKQERAGGILAIFLMAFTLAVVSFSCTGPIIGFLLVDIAASGSLEAPAIGMLGFGVALALPFTWFALFPSWIKKMPKSGNWMNGIKVTLAFVEFAFALKFLSVADMAYGWGILPRNTFVLIWAILTFGLLLYWMGWIRFPHDLKEKKSVLTTRIVAFLILFPALLYLLSGLFFHTSLNAISAFAPPQEIQLGDQGGMQGKHFRDYDEGIAYARKHELPILLDFTGFGCVNCRKMEASVWDDSTVKELMNKHFVVISLYVDDRTELASPLTKIENGKEILLETIGEKWSYLQRMKFGANAQPFYVIIDQNGHPVTATQGFTENATEFAKFLQEGLTRAKGL